MEYINKILNNSNGSSKDLRRLFIKYYGSLDYIDEDGSLYHKIVKSTASFSRQIEAIEMLINNNVSQNIVDSNNYTYLHILLFHTDLSNANYLIKFAINNGFKVNIKDNFGSTILHVAIRNYRSNAGDLMKLMIMLEKADYDFSVIDKNGRNLVEYIFTCDNLSYNDKNYLKDFIDKANIRKIESDNTQKNINIDEIKSYGTLLNNKKYDHEPAIARDKEVNDLIISLATDKKLPILVGPSGVGKTTIVDELAYRIKNGDVPNFLKNKLIFELHLTNTLAGTKYRGEFEKNLTGIFKYINKYDMILFIDEFHMAFGAGASEYDKSDAANMLKTYIDRYNIKVIGATTIDEYNEYMSHDALKRRFDVIKVNELDDSKLYLIAEDTINNLAIKKNIFLNEEVTNNIDNIIKILLELTEDKCRKYDDKIYNPDLIIGIIDRAFAYMHVDNDYELMIKHFIMAISDNERIYDFSKERAIKKLNYLDIIDNKQENKIIDINEYKKKHILV